MNVGRAAWRAPGDEEIAWYMAGRNTRKWALIGAFESGWYEASLESTLDVLSEFCFVNFGNLGLSSCGLEMALP